jgi:hypothetical protein
LWGVRAWRARTASSVCEGKGQLFDEGHGVFHLQA